MNRTRRRGRALLVGAALAAGLTACSPAAQVLAPQNDTAPAAVARTTATHPAPTGGPWLSGASSEAAADGSFGRWRRAPVQVGGTWENSDPQQTTLDSVCPGGAWATWNKPLDLAVGAIDHHLKETWAAAAKGAYDDRWRRSFLRLKQCWGKRDPANLYLRFAHELNLSSMPWSVKGGEEKAFARAITRYSTLRYQILPRAHVVLCPSDGTDDRLGVDLAKLWPGPDAKRRKVVDVYAVDTYNGYVVVHDALEFGQKLTALQNGQPFGLETHRQFAEDHGVPFAISEWSNNGDPQDAGHGADLPGYVQSMNEWFRAHGGDIRRPKPGQLLYEVQFNLQRQFSLFPTRLQPQTAAAYRRLTWGR